MHEIIWFRHTLIASCVIAVVSFGVDCRQKGFNVTQESILLLKEWSFPMGVRPLCKNLLDFHSGNKRGLVLDSESNSCLS